MSAAENTASAKAFRALAAYALTSNIVENIIHTGYVAHLLPKYGHDSTTNKHRVHTFSKLTSSLMGMTSGLAAAYLVGT